MTDEIIGMLKIILSEIDISDDVIDFDLLKEIGARVHYLDTIHTYRYSRGSGNPKH